LKKRKKRKKEKEEKRKKKKERKRFNLFIYSEECVGGKSNQIKQTNKGTFDRRRELLCFLLAVESFQTHFISFKIQKGELNLSLFDSFELFENAFTKQPLSSFGF